MSSSFDPLIACMHATTKLKTSFSYNFKQFQIIAQLSVTCAYKNLIVMARKSIDNVNLKIKVLKTKYTSQQFPLFK
jgi:hypothetical protein